MIEDAWNNEIDITNMLPAFFAKYYIDFQDWYYSNE